MEKGQQLPPRFPATRRVPTGGSQLWVPCWPAWPFSAPASRRPWVAVARPGRPWSSPAEPSHSAPALPPLNRDDPIPARCPGHNCGMPATAYTHEPHPHLEQRHRQGPVKTVDLVRLHHPNPVVRFNARVGLRDHGPGGNDVGGLRVRTDRAGEPAVQHPQQAAVHLVVEQQLPPVGVAPRHHRGAEHPGGGGRQTVRGHLQGRRLLVLHEAREIERHLEAQDAEIAKILDSLQPAGERCWGRERRRGERTSVRALESAAPSRRRGRWRRASVSWWPPVRTCPRSPKRTGRRSTRRARAWNPVERLGVHPGAPGDGLPPERINSYFVPRLFAEIGADDMIDGVLEACRVHHADIVLHEPYAFAGPLAAAVAGIPAVNHQMLPLDLDVFALGADAVSPLWRALGFDGAPRLPASTTVRLSPSARPRSTPGTSPARPWPCGRVRCRCATTSAVSSTSPRAPCSTVRWACSVPWWTPWRTSRWTWW